MNFQSDDEARDWADAWVQGHVPSAVVANIKHLEVEHFRRFNVEYGRFVPQFEVQYSTLVEVLDAVNYVDRSSWPQHRSVQYALLSYNVKTFHSAVDRIMRGYYEDGITLVRGLYETFVRTMFVSCYPDEAYSAFMFKPPKDVRRFNLTNFLEHDLGVRWATKYEVTSAFAHSNSLDTLRALTRAVNHDGVPEVFGFRLEFDVRLAEVAVPMLNFVLLTHLRFAQEALLQSAPTATPDLVTSLRESIGLLAYGLTAHPKDYWHTVASDLDLLFEMLAVADRREDWKAFLKDRRK